ncbi:MAG: hypothetical protein ABL958_05005 [Bdellovibrionia bacterium]
MGRNKSVRVMIAKAAGTTFLALIAMVAVVETASWFLNLTGFARDREYPVFGSQEKTGAFEIPTDFESAWTLSALPAPHAKVAREETVDVSDAATKFFVSTQGGLRGPPPNLQATSIVRTNTGQVLFSESVSTDAHGRRRTIEPREKYPSTHLLVFGCSFAWGWAVGDWNTLPSRHACIISLYPWVLRPRSSGTFGKIRCSTTLCRQKVSRSMS